MPMSPDDSSGERDPVERLAEEFVARRRRGEDPSPIEYAERYPQWAQRIHALFPALLLMEQHRPGVSDSSASAEDAEPAPAPLEKLGDYRIIREVGRGGMAIVYEAEQESLGRHVALKVLLGHSRLDPSRTARFQREARAAARLHHTNIVPVYGVGEHEGIHYYVMQFIPGQALDEVLREVRRLRRHAPVSLPLPGDDRSQHHGRSGAVSATDVARELLTGRFAPIEPQPGDLQDSIASARFSPDAITGPRRTAPDTHPLIAPAVTAPADGTGSSVNAPSQADSSSLSGSSRQYWRGVARIGEQVSEALQYAHAQGILHRDIKPSNLLLDLHGTVWVADFGLAKAMDQADLTHPGDVVGTWRYMAPERFQGVSDARSDVYSLGLTLYELLTLHPAFDGSTREQLMHQVGYGVPPRPRKVNPDVPRDLETIVLKSIERDPASRYQTAGELAEDLRRLLDDRPIQARRCSPLERAWRWARRNPAIASLGASVVVLLVTLAMGSTLAAFWLNAERKHALDNLWNAYVAQARATRTSHMAGQRLNSLDVLTSAARLRITSELRNEATACMPLVDFLPMRRLVTKHHEDDGSTIDRALERYAFVDAAGNITVRRVADGREIARIPRSSGPNRFLEFSPDGRYLVAAHAMPGQWAYELWDLESRESPGKVLELGDVPLHFPPDSRCVAFSPSDTTIEIHDPSSGELRTRLIVAPISKVCGFHPDGRRLTVIDKTSRTVRLIDIERGQDTWSRRFDVNVDLSQAWGDDGNLLAVAGQDHRIYVWDILGDRLQSVLEGHQNSIVRLQFTHAGNLLLSASWDGTTRVWDPIRGTLLITSPGGLIHLGRDDRQLAMHELGLGMALWELADGRECRALHHGMIGNRTPRPDNWGPNAVDFSSDGRLLASSDTDGVRFWDPTTGRQLAHLSLADVATAQFSPDGASLLIYRAAGPQLWPLSATGEGTVSGLRIGPPRSIGRERDLSFNIGAWDGTGRYLTLGDTSRTYATLLEIATSTEVARLGPHRGLNQFPISADGRWVATATWKGHDVKVWEVATGRLAWQMSCDSAMVRFSPDNRWLAVAKFPGLECRLWHLDSWQPGPTIRVSRELFTMAFARDGRWLAIDDGGRVRLVDPESGREVATLDAGTGSSANFFCMALSPDSAMLAAGRDHIVHLWDLRRIREQLAPLRLDWDAPPFPSPAAHRAVASVVVVGPTNDGANPDPKKPSTASEDRPDDTASAH